MLSARPDILPKELLDGLPPESPEAQASRRDLRIFNRLLGSERWIAQMIRRHVDVGERVLEIGAGDGHLALSMIGSSIEWDCLDLSPRPDQWPSISRWISADLLAESWRFDQQVVVANLILHHFTAAQLASIGDRLRSQARVIIVSDLVRSRFRETVFKCVASLINAHRVSYHDGQLSIRAGFRGNELSEMLGLASAHWKINWGYSITGAYRLIAVKRDDPVT